jgi:hypothetical protein
MAEVPPTPWTDRSPQAKARRQEIRNGNLPGGSRQPASGRHWRAPRDNTLFELLVETRRSDGGSYRVTAQEFSDIERQARLVPPGLQPAMQIDLEGHRLLLVTLELHLEMKARIAYLEDQLATARD